LWTNTPVNVHASAAWSTATSPVTTSVALGVTRLATRQRLVLLEATAVD